MPKSLLDPKLARKVSAILDQHLGAAIGVLYGKDQVSPESWKLALGLGLVDPAAPTDEITQQLHLFGVYMAHVSNSGRDPARYGTTADEFLSAIEEDATPTSDVEYGAQDAVRARAANYCRGLGNTIDRATGNILIEADSALRADMKATIRDALGATFGDKDAEARMEQRGLSAGKPSGFYGGAFRATLKRIESDLGHATQDWARDWRRIVQTEAQGAIQAGKVDGWNAREADRSTESKEPVRRIVAYKLPRPGACKHCIRLHTEGGVPRLYHLEELEGNGSNVGRRRTDWVVTIEPAHPWCACELLRVPSFATLPAGWSSGRAAPSVIGSDGLLVLPGT